MRTEWGTPARVVPHEELASEVGTTAYHGGLALDSGGVLHPGKWFAGLVGLAEAAGAGLHEGVRALAIRRQPDGRFVVETSRGAIHARDVLVATNAYTDGVAPALRRRIIPIGSYIIATEPLPEDLACDISPTGRAYFHTRNFLSHWHVSADRRLIWGGRVSFFPTSVDKTARLLYPRMLEAHPAVSRYRLQYSWGRPDRLGPPLASPHIPANGAASLSSYWLAAAMRRLSFPPRVPTSLSALSPSPVM